MQGRGTFQAYKAAWLAAHPGGDRDPLTEMDLREHWIWDHKTVGCQCGVPASIARVPILRFQDPARPYITVRVPICTLADLERLKQQCATGFELPTKRQPRRTSR